MRPDHHPHRAATILDLLKDGAILTAQQMAEAADAGERSIYRSIETLRRQGHRIVADRGVGFMLRRSAQ